MINELPELGDIFSKESSSAKNKIKQDDAGNQTISEDKQIYIYVSKEKGNWMLANFIDVAPGGVGIHVILPINIEFGAEDLNKFSIKFEKKKDDDFVVIKEVPVLVRWQERDSITGRMKLGLHFHGDVKFEPTIVDTLRALSYSKK